MVSKQQYDKMTKRLEAIERDFAEWDKEFEAISRRAADLAARVKAHNLKYSKELS